jgi:hypothetical protein
VLRDEQITELWRRYRAETAAWDVWRRSYLDLVAELRQMDQDTLASAATQEKLWNARALCSLGNGEHIQVQAAWSDPQVVQAVAALPSRRWSPRGEIRAQEIEETFGQLMALVSPRHTTSRPNAKLQRLMAALLPEELHCVIGWSANRDLVELLLPDRRGRAPVSSQVLARARLRDVLGQEVDLAQHVDRSLFCWWLHGQSEALRRNTNWSIHDEGAASLGPLRLWGGARMFKGLPTLPGGAEALRDVTRLALPGVTRQDLVEGLGADPHYARLSASSRRGLVQQALLLGLLEDQQGLLHPTTSGSELLEDFSRDILTEQILCRVYGPAHLLQQRLQSPKGDLEGWAQGALENSAWTLEGLLGWMLSLGLVQTRAPHALTAEGQRWARRLPAELPELPPRLWTPGRHGQRDPEQAPQGPPRAPELREVFEALQAAAQASGLVLQEEHLQALHLAWHSHPRKRFAILSGLSGTGKTALALAYARAYCQVLGLDPEAHREVVAVSPDWRDPTGLLGYFSALHQEPVFLAEPALRLMLRAARDPRNPYFLILDEMNLARVERYLAPLLSAMETGEPVVLHTAGEEVSQVPPRLDWPHNLFLAGTVNMDESTHAFSDKVLDRAFTLEFWDVDLARFFEVQPHPRDPETEGILHSLYEALRPARRHFGYRSAAEVLAFVRAAERSGVDKQRALDQALFSRILPRLRGEDAQPLRQALEQTWALCQEHDLARCAQKLGDMHQRLMQLGVTRFWA